MVQLLQLNDPLSESFTLTPATQNEFTPLDAIKLVHVKPYNWVSHTVSLSTETNWVQTSNKTSRLLWIQPLRPKPIAQILRSSTAHVKGCQSGPSKYLRPHCGWAKYKVFPVVWSDNHNHQIDAHHSNKSIWLQWPNRCKISAQILSIVGPMKTDQVILLQIICHVYGGWIATKQDPMSHLPLTLAKVSSPFRCRWWDEHTRHLLYMVRHDCATTYDSDCNRNKICSGLHMDTTRYEREEYADLISCYSLVISKHIKYWD